MSTWRCLLIAGLTTTLLTANADQEPENEMTSPHLEVLEVCLSDVGDTAATDQNCIGVSVYSCLEGAFTTVDMLSCIEPERAYWDDRLNRAYRSLYAVYTQQDTEDGFSPVKLAPRLRDVQRVWITWRDAKCGLAYDKFRGGSMGRITGADCHLQETAERALELEDLLEEASP
jgi:uncharacterized protein YecT (DUF1311 family)